MSSALRGLPYTHAVFARHIPLLAAATLAVVLVAPARADTELADPAGNLKLTAPGKWRTHETELAFSATGFLGVKRAELFAVVYDDEKDANGAAKRWKAWREKDGGGPVFTHDDSDALHWSAHSAERGTVDYVRALAGADRSAVVWVRLSGAPGDAADDSRKLLGAAVLAAPEKERPGPGGEMFGGGKGDETAKPSGVTLKDQDFRVAITLPAGFTVRKEIEPDGRRVLSTVGPVGSDERAFVDVYALDSFLRADAAGRWWQISELRGWDKAPGIEGDAISFRVDPAGELWSRHVRIIHTKAGVYGLKLDIASQAEQAATKMLDALLRDGIEVLKERPSQPSPMPGTKAVEGNGVTMFVPKAATDGGSIQTAAERVDKLIGTSLGLEPFEERRGFVHVHRDAPALQAALRPIGAEAETNAYWDVGRGIVHTHSGVLSDDAGQDRLYEELARDAIHRRFGFRPPWWIERGLALVAAGMARNNGRSDLAHPGLIDGARNAAVGSVEFEAARWWSEDDSSGNDERDAVVWSFAFLFAQRGPLAKKYETPFTEYITRLRTYADANQAGKAFDFAREREYIDDWKKWVRKL